eukprot:gene551-298_t
MKREDLAPHRLAQGQPIIILMRSHQCIDIFVSSPSSSRTALCITGQSLFDYFNRTSEPVSRQNEQQQKQTNSNNSLQLKNRRKQY